MIRYVVFSFIPFISGDLQIANILLHLVTQAMFSSANLNIFIRQPDGSYEGDSLDSPRGDEDSDKSWL